MLAAGAVLSGSAAGWVWAPYSDIVSKVAPRRHRPTLPAVITTGTTLSLVALAALALLASAGSWRLTWAGIAVAAAAAALVNVRAVPRIGAPRRDADAARASPWRRSMSVPLAYTVLYFAAITIYFTYASASVRSASLDSSTPPLMFALIGIGGLPGLWTGRMTHAVGVHALGAGSILLTSCALVLLGLGRGSLAVPLPNREVADGPRQNPQGRLRP